MHIWAQMSSPLLEVRDLVVRYGHNTALWGVDLEVSKGEVVAVLGPNGAGKSTLAAAISGALPKARGKVYFKGEDISRRSAPSIARRGLIHVPEGRGIFYDLTVRENLALSSLVTGTRLSAFDRQWPHVWTEFPRLKERLSQRAGSLSGGEQQMLALARSMLCGPDLLILDEASLGLAPQLVDRVFAVIGDIVATGVAVLLIEQNVFRSIKAADRCYVLSSGRVVAAGDADVIASTDAARAAYLGGDVDTGRED